MGVSISNTREGRPGLLAAVGVFWFILSIWTFAAHPGKGGAINVTVATPTGSGAAAGGFNTSAGDAHYVLPILLLCLSALWLAAAVLGRQKLISLGRPDTGGMLMLFGGMTIGIEIAIRLASAEHFGGSVPAFDFGIKCKRGQCEPSIAFEPGFNSFGHCIQGCLSALLVPVVEQAVSDSILSSHGQRTRLVASFVAIYPVYNLAKRALHGPRKFASSSFANNAAEWVTGFQLGIAVAMVIAAKLAPPNSKASAEAPETRERQNVASRAATTITRLRTAVGALLCATSLVIGVLMGYSWNNTGRYGPKDDDKVDNVMIIALVCVPVVMLLIWRKVGGKSQRDSLIPATDDIDGAAGVVPTSTADTGDTELAVQKPKSVVRQT